MGIEESRDGRAAVPMRRRLFDMPAEYTSLRDDRPVCPVTLPNGAPAWIVTRYEHARQLLGDQRVSVDRGDPRFPDIVSREGARGLKARGMLTWMDPPEHSVHRRMLNDEFTGTRVRRLRPFIQGVADEHVDQMLQAARPVDVARALAVPVTQLVIGELLGIPSAERSAFDRVIDAMLNRSAPPEERASCWSQVRGYLGDLITEKARDPGDDLLSRMVKKYESAGMADRELLIGLAMTLRGAGHESTASMISAGVVGLLAHPGQLAEFRADPALAPRVVEELLRFFSVADLVTGRIATADIEIGGVAIREGDAVMVLNGAANHDGRAFDEPDRFSIRRDAWRHIAFGHGIHRCIGQNLARLELEVVLTTLFCRIPGLRLAVPVEELVFRHGGSFYGLEAVPVTW